MAKILYRLGGWAVRKKGMVLFGGLALIVITAILVLTMGVKFSSDMSIPGTRSEMAASVLKEEFPSSDSVKPGGEVLLILKAPEGLTLESKGIKTIVDQKLNEVSAYPEVASVVSPNNNGSLTENKQYGYATVTYRTPAGEVNDKDKEKIIKVAEQLTESGVQTELSGTIAFSEMEIGGIGEAIGVVVAYLVLVVTFASFLAAGMPILTAVAGLGLGLLTIMVGTNFLDIPSVSLSLAAMLSLAVGIDYALFIMTRFRQEVGKGRTVPEAIAIATATAGSAVVFAGLTVVIALVGLAIAKVPFLTMMGIASALCVIIAIVVAVIIVPAVLGFVGHRIAPSKQKVSKTKFKAKNRWGKLVVKRPVPIALAGIALLAVISIPFFHMELGLPDNGSKSQETIERQAYDLLKEAYGPGYHAPLVIVAQAQGEADPQESINKAVESIKDLPQIESMSPAYPSPGGQAAMITITPKTGPNDTETKELVNQIRTQAETIQDQMGVTLMVTGATAVNIDISQMLNKALPKFALVIVGLAIVLLTIVFRSLLIPIKAVAGFLLSLAATLGFVVFVLQDGHLLGLFGIPEAGPVLNFLPVIVVGILFGLAMDYEVFLVSRMREEFSHTGDARQSVLAGMGHSGSVVTAAGLIMVAVFAGFIFAHDPIIKSMGLALTFGVLFDAFIVRLAIVPAIMTLMGKSAWYLPKWLDRILPNIDIEGESISKLLEAKHQDNLPNQELENKKSLIV